MWWQGIDPCQAARFLGREGCLYHFHAKDAAVDPSLVSYFGLTDMQSFGTVYGRAWQFRTVGFGHGLKEWADIFGALRASGYDEVASIEHEDSFMSVEEGLDKAISNLRQVMMSATARRPGHSPSTRGSLDAPLAPRGPQMINTLTLNPAIDKVIYLDSLEKNHTNRTEGTAEVIGGKGSHVPHQPEAAGNHEPRLRDLPRRGRKAHHRLPGRLRPGGGLSPQERGRERTNYLLVERSNDCTIVAEKGVPLGGADLAQLVSSLKAGIKPGDWLILSGDAGNCADPFVYNGIMDELRDRKLRVFVDTSGPALARCIQSAPFLIKPNLRELSSLCGREVGCNDEDILHALESLNIRGVEIVAVSLGSAGSILSCPQGLYKAVPPCVNVRNTIGCGDCYLAGLVYGISQGKSMEETLRVATAASAATAESSLSVGFDPARAHELAAACEVRRLG